MPELPSEVHKFAIIAFTYNVTSVIVEGLFSHMKYNQSGSRSRVGDDRAVDVISCKDFKPVDANPASPLTAPDWDPAEARKHNLTF